MPIWLKASAANSPLLPKSVASLLSEVRACSVCAQHLPLGPRPIVQVHACASILIVSQAPGRKVHATGVPFNDASGNRLRTWLGMSREVFYDSTQVAILPMGFCFPGTGKSGDLPPRPECAPLWRQALLAQMKHVQLTLVIGQYALAYHLPGYAGSVTVAVQAWRKFWPGLIPLPHPSPRNNLWLRRNPWFEEELVPLLRQRVIEVLQPTGTSRLS
jgi:uracil-DNA glycosylase